MALERLIGPAAAFIACGLMLGCGAAPAPSNPAPGDPGATPPREAPFARRAFAPAIDGQPVIAGISYGPYREGQKPGGPDPDAAQITEDLRIIAARWGMIRLYSSRGPAETILRVMREQKLPLRAMVGAWIAPPTEPDAAAANAAEVAEAIRLARAYPEQVIAVSVGNESQVDWSAHRSPRDALIGYIRAVRAGVTQPVTTADDYNFWNKPAAQAVAAEVDFLLLHAYAMWNGKQLAEAVPWTAGIVDGIRALHPSLPIVLGETGWATALDPDGGEVEHIKAPAGEAEQARFFAEFTAWATAAGLPYFYFEAFDEPWKGSDNPREVEKHWGLYDVNRQPKAAMKEPSP